MSTKVRDLIPGQGPKSQVMEVQQIGVNVDGTLAVAIAAAGAGTGDFSGSRFARAKGKLGRIYAANITTALTVDATCDVIPFRYTKKCGLAKAAATLIPMLDAPGIRLTVLDLAGAVQQLLGSALQETESTQVLQAPGAANQIKLAAADTHVDGFWCDADVTIIGGTGVGQKNRITGYTSGTKVGTVKNLAGTPNWLVATVAGSIAKVRSRRYVFDKDDFIQWVVDFTVAAGAAGVDLLTGVEIDFDDTVNV